MSSTKTGKYSFRSFAKDYKFPTKAVAQLIWLSPYAVV